MSIGKNISKYRKAKCLTQEELGSRLGVTNQAVSKWESEISMPDVMLLPEIISVLNISFEELYSIGKQVTALPKHSEEFYGNANKTLISLLYDHIGHLIVFPEIQVERTPELYEKEKNPITGKIEHTQNNKSFNVYSDTKGYAYISNELSVLAPDFMLFEEEDIFRKRSVLSALRTIADSKASSILSFMYRDTFNDKNAYQENRKNVDIEKEYDFKEFGTAFNWDEDMIYETLEKLVSLTVLEKRGKTYVLYKPKLIQLMIMLKTLDRMTRETNCFGWGTPYTLTCNYIDEYLI